MDQKPNARCPKCQNEFFCGCVAYKENKTSTPPHCWCMDLPTLKEEITQFKGQCLCPDCLKKALQTLKK